MVLDAHNQEDFDTYCGKAQEVSKFCERWGTRYQEILGSSEYFEHLLQAALIPEQANADFTLVLLGSELRQVQFMRLVG